MKIQLIETFKLQIDSRDHYRGIAIGVTGIKVAPMAPLPHKKTPVS